MTGWRARLAMLKARRTDAESAGVAERQGDVPTGRAIGAIGPNGTGAESAGEAGAADRAAFYRQAAEDAAVALAAYDPDLAHERSEMAAAMAAPAAADPWHPGEPDPLRDGLLVAALARPPSCSNPTCPPRGAWCSCCGRWWREAVEPKGWRCGRCYPSDHLRADQVVEVRT